VLTERALASQLSQDGTHDDDEEEEALTDLTGLESWGKYRLVARVFL
jgi:hypothetical protein